MFSKFYKWCCIKLLIKKKNCSKFYVVYALGSKESQKQLIKAIKDTNIIIAYNERIDAKNYKDEPNYKLWIVKDYIKKYFNIIYEEGDRIILKRNAL